MFLGEGYGLFSQGFSKERYVSPFVQRFIQAPLPNDLSDILNVGPKMTQFRILIILFWPQSYNLMYHN